MTASGLAFLTCTTLTETANPLTSSAEMLRQTSKMPDLFLRDSESRPGLELN